jgi:hypothetical protein
VHANFHVEEPCLGFGKLDHYRTLLSALITKL